MAQSLEGVRVMVVEDDFLIAELLDEILRSRGCVVLGPLSRLALALDAAKRDTCDAALLDVNLAGEFVFPVAAVLSERHVPFMFLTGYSVDALPPEYAGQPRLGKPFKADQLAGALSNLIHPPERV
jgi:DNA-binding response OmpR family regulator